ncbi:MAG TPA: polysaccharide biosynthesis tyrosine autokinase [Candidatus Hydrogenedentes bacterium]|nr:polysaccharide biosynthesis tyrosine autokinase [Candidatus Hydrogenedentota bacterium]
MVSDTPPLDQATPQGRGENQLRFLLNVGLRRWRLIFACTLTGLILFGVFGTINLENPLGFEASTQFRVVKSPWQDLRDIGGSPARDITAEIVVKEIENNLRPFAEKVARALVQRDIEKSRAGAALATEEDLQRRGSAVQSTLAFEPIPGKDLIALRVQGSTPEEARETAEAAARVFIDTNVQSMKDDIAATHDFVQQQLELMRKDLDAAEKKEWEMRQAMGFRTRDRIVEDMERKRQELLDASEQRTQLLAKVEEIGNTLRSKNEQLPESLGQITDDVVRQLLGELDNLLQQQLSMSIVYTSEYPGLQEIEEEIREKKRAILEAVGKLQDGPLGGSSVWEERQTLRQQYLQLQLDLTSLDIRTATTQKLLQAHVDELPALAEKNLEYRQTEQEVEQLRAQFKKLIEKEFEVRTQLQRGLGHVEWYSPVDVRQSNVAGNGLKYWITWLLGALVGLGVGFGLSIILEMLDTSIRGIEDVNDYIGLEVIGTIPEMKFTRYGRVRRRGNYVVLENDEQADACIVTLHDPKSPISEAYRALRTNFQFANIQSKARLVMVTSAVPGEGKTTTAVNLAITLADSGVKVLLIDTDLRRPHVHHVLKMERGPGLADVLREGIDFHNVVRPTRVENLTIVSSGRVPPNPSELIGSERMQRLMDQLRHEFDMIIFDAPSILVVTDPVLLASHVDMVILVVSVNNARRETILRARRLLDAAQARVAGIVLNGLEATRRHYYYYYYYYDEEATRRKKNWYHL